MRRPALLLGFLALLAAALVAPSGAAAHPLGNFTVNRFSRVEVSGHRLYVRYVLDMAEIPTFQAQHDGGIDGAVYSRRIARGARLAIDGRPARLVAVTHALAFPKGAGGLRTTRLEVVLRGPRLRRPARISYRDSNYADRLGWKEIVVGATTPSPSDELRAYPKSLLQSPLDVTSAHAVLAPTSGPDIAPALARGAALQAPDRIADGGFASLISKRRLSVGFVLLSLCVAFFWGAVHALSPGHGKSIVAAYLVGARGTPRHALLLGLTVTATHTIGVFALGLVTLSLSAFVVPDHLYPWLNLASALLVVSVGISVLSWRIREWRHHADQHRHGHHHHHHDPALGSKRLLGVGISGGIIPCPTALVVLLAAISLHRVGFGLLLIVAFSLGLAGAMTGIGVAAVTAKRVFGRASVGGGLLRLLPAVSALVVLGLGLVMIARAFTRVS